MKIKVAEINKILLITSFRFGDTLLNSAYLPSLREKFPNAKISFLTRKPCQKMLEDNPNIDNFVLFENKKGVANIFERIKLFHRVRKENYDLLIDQNRGTTGGQITFFSGAKYRLGYSHSRYSKFFNLIGFEGKQRYSALMRFDLLKPLGINEPKQIDLYFTIKDKDKIYIKNCLEKGKLIDKKLIVLSPGSPVPRKMWSLENYAKLCDLIIEKTDYKPLLLWGPNELELVKKVQQLSKKEILLAPPTDFSQAGALLKHSKILVCNDGGINHFSQTTKTPSLAIFMDYSEITNWSLQGIFPNHWHITDKNKDKITADLVFDKLLDCLKIIEKR